MVCTACIVLRAINGRETASFYLYVQGGADGVVHAWVGQIVLVCDESKTKSVRPTEARVGYDNHGWRGQGCTWLAVS